MVAEKKYSFDKVFIHESAWYSGDFHAHTNASPDGEYPPMIVAAIARAEGLDFVSITDHNTINGLSKFNPDLDFPIIPGMEVTLDKGHFNVFGIGESQGWVEDIGENTSEIPLPFRFSSVTELMELTAGEGLLNSINHPLLHPWHWRFQETDLHFVHCVELWNDLYWPGNLFANPKTVDLWTAWLNAGHRVTAIGGSDYHYPPKPEQGLTGERLSQPTTHVFAENLSAPAILEGLRKSRVYITKGPKVEFSAHLNGTCYMVGDVLRNQAGNLDFTVSIDDGPDHIIAQLVRNGEIIASQHIPGPQASIEIRDQAVIDHTSWYRLEVLDKNWEVLAITNPIFLNIQDNDRRSSPGMLFW